MDWQWIEGRQGGAGLHRARKLPKSCSNTGWKRRCGSSTLHGGQSQATTDGRLGHPGQDFMERHPAPVREIGGPDAAPPGIVLAEDGQEFWNWSDHALKYA